MATRQYIGARYVPKFYTNSVDGTTQWEANVVYDPLIYVTLTNGHMYISKKQIPATVGTPASNADYWLDIGSYNGFIDHLQNQIDDIDSEIQILTTNITNNTNNIKTNPYIDAVLNGIDNTGTNDVTADVQALMNANPKAIIFFKSGSYKFNSSLTMRASILGEAGTELHYTGSGDFLVFDASSSSLSVEEINITCNTTGSANRGIYANQAALLKFKNLHLTKCSIHLSLCRVCYLENIWSDYAYKGLYLGSCVRIFLDSFEFSNTTTNGIEITKSSSSQLSDVIEISNGECNVSGSYAINCHDMTDGFARFYFVQTSSGTTNDWYFNNTDQMSLINCYAEAGTHTVNYGIVIQNSSNATLYNFHAVGFSAAGIRLVASSKITLDSSQVWDCPTGIETVANSTDGCDECIIINSHIYYNVTTGINFYRSSTLYNENCIVKDNIISATTPLNINDSHNTSATGNIDGNGNKLEYATATTDQYGSITISIRNLKNLPIVHFTGNDIAFACIQSSTSSGGYYTSVRYQLIKYVIDNGAWVFKTADSQSIEYAIDY